MTPTLEHLYAEAREAHAEVARTKTAYEEATRRRAALLRELRDHGQSRSMIANMLEVSKSRVDQLIGDGPRRRVSDAE